MSAWAVLLAVGIDLGFVPADLVLVIAAVVEIESRVAHPA